MENFIEDDVMDKYENSKITRFRFVDDDICIQRT